VSLDIHGTVVERLDSTTIRSGAAMTQKKDDEDAVAGPIAIAVDITETDNPLTNRRRILQYREAKRLPQHPANRAWACPSRYTPFC
jgi:hypothetical protein